MNYYRKNYNFAYITQYRFVYLDYSVLKRSNGYYKIGLIKNMSYSNLSGYVFSPLIYLKKKCILYTDRDKLLNIVLSINLK